MVDAPSYDPSKDWKRAIQPVNPQAGTYGGLTANLNPMGGGSGFAYDRETLHKLAQEWRDLAREFRDDRAHAETLAKTQGPGAEYASEGNAEMIRASGKALLDSLSQRANYCDAMADKYASALGKYATAEETHAAEIKKPEGLA